MDHGLFAMFAMACILCNASDYHHLNMGPEICVMRDYENNYGNSYNKISVIGGISINYEYLEPNNFYVGATGKYMVGNMTLSATRIYPQKTWYDTLKMSMTRKSIEGALGYNFLAYRDFMVTPYIGIGDRYTSAISNSGKLGLRMSSDALYLTHGVRSEYVMSDKLHFGINFKQYCTLKGVSKSNVSHQFINPMWGAFEISFPWAVRFAGGGESLVVKFDPYFRKDSIMSGEWSMGACLQISCDF